jgi:hypothetical protein
MFTLLESLNQTLDEAMERRTPVFKASGVDPKNSSKVAALDVQHLPALHPTFTASRLISQILSQFKAKFEFNFETKASGLFNTLIVKAMPDKGDKYIQFEVSELTHSDVDELKRAIYRTL